MKISNENKSKIKYAAMLKAKVVTTIFIDKV